MPNEEGGVSGLEILRISDDRKFPEKVPRVPRRKKCRKKTNVQGVFYKIVREGFGEP
jgi:hypothetical protein